MSDVTCCLDCNRRVAAYRIRCARCADAAADHEPTVESPLAVLRAVPPDDVRRDFAAYAGRYEDLTAEQRAAVEQGLEASKAETIAARKRKRESAEAARDEHALAILNAPRRRRGIRDLPLEERRAYARAVYHSLRRKLKVS